MEEETIKRFEAKTEIKVIAALSKMLNDGDGTMTEERALTKPFLVMTYVMGVCALTEEAKRTLSRFYSENDKEIKEIPKLEYEPDSSGKTAKYNLEYMERALKVLKACGKNVKVSMKGEYPVTLENEHFKIFIAPRVENY